MLSQYRQIARESLQGNWFKLAMISFALALVYPVVAVVLLKYLLPADLPSVFAKALYNQDILMLEQASGLLDSAMNKGMLIGMGCALIVSPLTVGLSWMSLGLVRKQNVEKTLFQPATQSYAKAVLVYVIKNMLVVIGLSLFIVPGVFLYLAFAMTFFVLRDKPQLGIFATLAESFKIMKGYKMQLFVLHLTFIGWALLVMISGLFVWSFLLQFFAGSVDQNTMMSVLIELEKTGTFSSLNFESLQMTIQQAFTFMPKALLLFVFTLNFFLSFLLIYLKTSSAVMYQRIIGEDTHTSTAGNATDSATTTVNSNGSNSSMDA